MRSIYKDTKFDSIVGVKVHKKRKNQYKKHNLNLSEIARKAWESSLKKAVRDAGQGTRNKTL